VVSMMFVLAALVVLLGGMGGVMLLGQRQRQDHEARMLGGGGDPDSIRRLAEAVESLQGQVTDLSERMDFTERLLEAPKDDGDPASG